MTGGSAVLSFEQRMTAISYEQVLIWVRAGLMSGGLECHGAARANCVVQGVLAPHLESMLRHSSPSKSPGATLGQSRACGPSCRSPASPSSEKGRSTSCVAPKTGFDGPSRRRLGDLEPIPERAARRIHQLHCQSYKKNWVTCAVSKANRPADSAEVGQSRSSVSQMSASHLLRRHIQSNLKY